MLESLMIDEIHLDLRYDVAYIELDGNTAGTPDYSMVEFSDLSEGKSMNTQGIAMLLESRVLLSRKIYLPTTTSNSVTTITGFLY